MQDSLGNAVTTSSAHALRLLDEAIDLHARAWPGALQAADDAVREDPGLALAHAQLAIIHMTWGRKPAALPAIVRALELSPRASPRERSVIELVHHIVSGRPHSALAWLLAHLRHHPADQMVLVPGMGAYGLFAFSGRADHNELRLSLLDDLEPHYPRDHAWLMAYRGWARIEGGAVQEGLAMARRAIALRPQNAHNAHIVAHGFHEAAEPAAYLDFLAGWLPAYPDDALMWGHLQWHAGLAELALGRQDAALQRCVGPLLAYLPRAAPFMGLIDLPALLWRLALRGVRDLPWNVAAEHAAKHFPKGANPFGELHICMVAAARQDATALRESCARLERMGEDGHHGAAAARAWALGLLALAEGDAQAAQAHFSACERDAIRLGGSHAQREVITETHSTRVPAAIAG